MNNFIFQIKKQAGAFLGISILVGLYLASLYSYPLFHSLAEVFSVAVACAIFMVAWNARRFLDNNYLLFVGIAYLFVGGLDLVHTLAYKGIGVFIGYDTNLPTQLWIAARYLESLSLLAAPLFLKRKLKVGYVLAVYSMIVALLLVSIFGSMFPVCFIEGTGLTLFKKISEYVISAILLGAIGFLFKDRAAFNESIFRYVVWSIMLTIASELCFTVYISAYGLANLVGHFSKILSFYLIYKAIVVTGLSKPYDLLFRSLKASEAALHRAYEELELRVQERTVELNRAYETLQDEVLERRQAQERLFNTLESITDGFLTLDRDWKLTYINSEAARMWHVKKEDILNKDFWKEIAPNAVGKEIYSQYQKAMHERVPVAFEALSSTLGIWFEARAYPSRDGLSVYLRDTTRQKRLEEQVRQAQKMEAIGTLASGIAHDFNNILAAIIGFAQMSLEDVPEESAIHRRISNVLKAGMRGRDLVKQILTFSRHAGQEKKAVDIASLIGESLKFTRATFPSTIEIRQSMAGRVVIHADPTQVQQVLMNLCTNAAHSMRGGNGVLTIGLSEVIFSSDGPRPHPDVVPGRYAKVSVSDTGCGMDEVTMGRIFEPFFTTKGPGEGTGLGLSVVHGIVKGHKGAITATSAPGRGSTFELFFPIIDETEGSMGEASTPAMAGHESILFVDDEEGLVQVGTEMLEKVGYNVVGVTNSLEALELIRENPKRFDLVITDQTMPHMTGLDLTKAIRQAGNHLPIILCTGFSESVSAESAEAAGVARLMMKPITRTEIARAIREVLDKKNQTYL